MRSAPVARAMTFMVIAMLLIPTIDAIAKSLATDYEISPGTVALGRFVGQSLIVIGIFAGPYRKRRKAEIPLIPSRPHLHLLRGALHGASTMAFFVAVKYMPIADTIAVFFVQPMILLMLSAVFLGEWVGWPRRISTGIAFLGALLVIQPSYELFGAISLLPLLSALFFALYLLFTRRLSEQEHPLTMQLWSGIGGLLAIGVALVVGGLVGISDYRLTTPGTGEILALLGLMGLISFVGHLLITTAFQLAPAATLAPFGYLEIVSATLLGYLVFDDLPGRLQWTGTLIIVGSGLFNLFRERRLEQQTKTAPLSHP